MSLPSATPVETHATTPLVTSVETQVATLVTTSLLTPYNITVGVPVQTVSSYNRFKCYMYLYLLYICISLCIISRDDIMWKLYWLAYAVTLFDYWFNLHVVIYFIITIVQFIVCSIFYTDSKYSLLWLIVLIDAQLIWSLIKMSDLFR